MPEWHRNPIFTGINQRLWCECKKYIRMKAELLQVGLEECGKAPWDGLDRK